MVLRPLDIVILLKIHCKGDQHWSQMSLAKELFISSRSVNEGLKRAAAARLYDPMKRKVWTLALTEALTKSIRYFMPITLGAMQRGVPTAWAARPLCEQIASGEADRPVWPYEDGEGFGPGVEPLHKSVPLAAAEDEDLGQLLALVDALRVGRARERALAAKAIDARLNP